MKNSSNILKTDIHCHLEACFRHQTLIETGDRVGLPVPADVDTFKRDYLVADQKENLAEMIAGFDRVRALWFDREAITRLTKEAVEDAAAQNVRLIELRYSPDFIQNGRNISFDVIHGAILDGISSANADIAVGLIGIIRRTLPLAEAQKVADFITANADSFVGIEDHPFKKLIDAGVKTTINTDDPSLFAIDWNSEYAVAKNALCLSPADINQCIENAKAASFINADTINKAWGA